MRAKPGRVNADPTPQPPPLRGEGEPESAFRRGGTERRVVVALLLVGVALGLVLAIRSPSLALWTLGGFAALACAIVRPEVVLYALPVAVTLDSTLVLAVRPLRAGPTDVLVGALAAGWVIRTALASRGPGATMDVRRSLLQSGNAGSRERAVALLVAGLALYLGVILLSGVVALSRALVLKEALKWGEVLVVVLIGAAHLRQPGRQRIAAAVILAAATAEALLAYGQWVFAVGDLGATGASLRIFGTFGQPNPFAAYLNLALPLALALALLVRDAWVRWPAAAVALLLLGAQALADSRGGLLGLGACVFVMLVVALGMERPAALIAVGGGALVALAWVTHILPASLQQRALHLLRLDGVSLTGPLNDANFSAVERLAHWVAGWRMFLAHPLLGVGAGNYDPAYPAYHVPGWNLSLGHAHNYYINAAAETGIIGLVVFLFLTGTMLYAPWRAARASDGADGAAGSAAAAPRHGGRPALRASDILTRIGDYLRARWERGRALALDGSSVTFAVALGVLGTVVALSVHNLVDDTFVHGIALQLGLGLALVVAILLGPEPAPAPADQLSQRTTDGEETSGQAAHS